MPNTDLEARRSLNRHRAFAGWLLAVMAGLVLLSYYLPQGWPSELLQAAAKAGFVGGIADWFAVTALFRHPLGIPIPHTAIIPNQKVRLGRALGRFVSSHVFTEAELNRTLARLDLPGILHRFLADPASTRPAAEALAAMMPRLLASIEDGRARRVVARIIPRMMGGAGAGRVVGAGAARADRGWPAPGGVRLHPGRDAPGAGRARGRAARGDRGAVVREQGGRLVGWALGASIARRAMGVMTTELEKMENGGSDMRAAFDEWGCAARSPASRTTRRGPPRSARRCAG